MRIGVIGTGAIGSSIAADLTDAGRDVILVDQWPAHVEKMRTDGLRVTMPDLELHLAAISLRSDRRSTSCSWR